MIQRYNDQSGAINHVAIVVQVYGSPGSVTSADVVDSNWISDPSGAGNHEVIARHNLPISALQGHFKIWTVPGY